MDNDIQMSLTRNKVKHKVKYIDVYIAKVEGFITYLVVIE